MQGRCTPNLHFGDMWAASIRGAAETIYLVPILDADGMKNDEDRGANWVVS